MHRPRIPSVTSALPGGLSSGLTSGLTGLASLAALIRERLGERLGEVSGSLRALRDAATPGAEGPDSDQTLRHESVTLIVAAAAPFATTSYARARLLRQMHASGLLSARETAQAEELLGVAL